MATVIGTTEALFARLVPPAKPVAAIAVLGADSLRLAIEQFTGTVAAVTVRRTGKRRLTRVPVATTVSTVAVLRAKCRRLSLFQFAPAVAAAIASPAIGNAGHAGLPQIPVTNAVATLTADIAIRGAVGTVLPVFRATTTVSTGAAGTAVLRTCATVFPFRQVTCPVPAIRASTGSTTPSIALLDAAHVPTIDATKRVQGAYARQATTAVATRIRRRAAAIPVTACATVCGTGRAVLALIDLTLPVPAGLGTGAAVLGTGRTILTVRHPTEAVPAGAARATILRTISAMLARVADPVAAFGRAGLPAGLAAIHTGLIPGNSAAKRILSTDAR